MKKKPTSKFEDKRILFLDWEAIKTQIKRLRISPFSLEEVVSKNTVKSIETGNGVYQATADAVAKHLGVYYTTLLFPDDPKYESPAPPNPEISVFAEWVVDDFSRTPHRASNELIYIISKMKHQHTANRRGRGKYYVLSDLPKKLREDLRQKLARHADVCFAVGQNRNIALNLSSAPAPDNEGWWVVDDWVGEQSLEAKCNKGPCPPSELPQLLLGIASGLQALHKASVVFRELHPSRVLISDLDGHAVLTDFELGKLLDGGPSVSSDWPEDPYRAPEVDGGNVSPRADLYSFGKTALFAAAGTIDHDVDASHSFTQVGVPKKITEYVLKCLEPIPARRPENVAAILKDLERWATKGR